MIIQSGKLKGKLIQFPKGKHVRPTSGRMKEALFSMIRPNLEGACVLDLCSGTGSLGLEAFSQGAKAVTLVDSDVTYVYKNIQSMIPKEELLKIKIKKLDVVQFIKREKEKYDIIFLDPPWAEFELYKRALKAISDSDILQDTGILVCEHGKKEVLEIPEALECTKTSLYGDGALSLIRKKKV